MVETDSNALNISFVMPAAFLPAAAFCPKCNIDILKAKMRMQRNAVS
jgi:hypothetical protein